MQLQRVDEGVRLVSPEDDEDEHEACRFLLARDEDDTLALARDSISVDRASTGRAPYVEDVPRTRKFALYRLAPKQSPPGGVARS